MTAYDKCIQTNRQLSLPYFVVRHEVKNHLIGGNVLIEIADTFNENYNKINKSILGLGIDGKY